ncbi:unnamed protein product, partial [Staurois parvus]
FSTKSGNPELHSGIPCGTAPACVLHLPYPELPRCVPCSVPAISSGRCRHPASVSCPCDVGTYGRRRRRRGYLKILKKCHFFFFTFYICFVRRPACILSVLS